MMRLAGLAAALVLCVAVADDATASVGLGASPTFPSPLTVGQENVPASLTIRNLSTAPDDAGVVIIDQVRLTPACGSPESPCPRFPSFRREPGVYLVYPAAVGASFGPDDQACLGRTFAVSLVDAGTGEVSFEPADEMGPVVLGAPHSPSEGCTIAFSFDVLAEPRIDTNPFLGFTSTNQTAQARGTSSVTASTTTGYGIASVAIIGPATPSPLPTATPMSTPTYTLSPTVTASRTPTRTRTAASTPTVTTTPTVTPTLVCPGDCNGDRTVVISEVVRCSLIFLATSPVSQCPSADIDRSGDVVISEVVRCANSFQFGCPQPPTPVPSASFTATAAATATFTRTRSSTPTWTWTPTATATPTPTPTATAVVSGEVRRELVPCFGASDVWQFEAIAGQSLTASAFNFDEAGQGDFCVDLSCNGLHVFGDEPASVQAVVSATGICTLIVATCSPICADPEVARYALQVRRDSQIVPLTLVGNGVPSVLSPTPKATPTTTPTISAEGGLNLQLFRSDNGQTYVLLGMERVRLNAADQTGAFGAQMTSLAISNGLVQTRNERIPVTQDSVVSSFAFVADADNVPLMNVEATGVIHGLNAVEVLDNDGLRVNGEFFPSANGGDGLLILPGGVRSVAAGGTGTEPVHALLAAGGGVPAAAVTRVARHNGAGESIVFPIPGAVCVGGTGVGMPCFADAGCPGTVTNPGRCSRTSTGSNCGPPSNVPCGSPGMQATECSGTLCSDFGGEREGQSVTLDDTLESRIGNVGSQGETVDGFFVRPHRSVVAFVVDSQPQFLAAGASGFLVTGTCSGGLNEGGPCTSDVTCGVGACSEQLAGRRNRGTIGATALFEPSLFLAPIEDQNAVVGKEVRFVLTTLGNVERRVSFEADPLPDGALLISAGDGTRNGAVTSLDFPVIDLTGDEAIDGSDLEQIVNDYEFDVPINRFVFLWTPQEGQEGEYRIRFRAVTTADEAGRAAFSLPSDVTITVSPKGGPS